MLSVRFILVLYGISSSLYVLCAKQTSLEYNPFPPPSFHPIPGDQIISQIIPPGKPLPANAGSQTPEINLNERFKETTTWTPTVNAQPVQQGSYPRPGDHLQGQIINTWQVDYEPDSSPYNPRPEDKLQSQINPIREEDNLSVVQLSNSGNMVDTTQTTTPEPTTKPQVISIAYQPNRPFYHPNPGNTVGQIIPPGNPWPASADSYKNFSVTGLPPSTNNDGLDNRIKATIANNNTSNVDQTYPSPQTNINTEYPVEIEINGPNPDEPNATPFVPTTESEIFTVDPRLTLLLSLLNPNFKLNQTFANESDKRTTSEEPISNNNNDITTIRVVNIDIDLNDTVQPNIVEDVMFPINQTSSTSSVIETTIAPSTTQTGEINETKIVFVPTTTISDKPEGTTTEKLFTSKTVHRQKQSTIPTSTTFPSVNELLPADKNAIEKIFGNKSPTSTFSPTVVIETTIEPTRRPISGSRDDFPSTVQPTLNGLNAKLSTTEDYPVVTTVMSNPGYEHKDPMIPHRSTPDSITVQPILDGPDYTPVKPSTTENYPVVTNRPIHAVMSNPGYGHKYPMIPHRPTPDEVYKRRPFPPFRRHYHEHHHPHFPFNPFHAPKFFRFPKFPEFDC